jgi:hypothetical protein
MGQDNGLGGSPGSLYCILACEQWNSPLYCDSEHPQVSSRKYNAGEQQAVQCRCSSRQYNAGAAARPGTAVHDSEGGSSPVIDHLTAQGLLNSRDVLSHSKPFRLSAVTCQVITSSPGATLLMPPPPCAAGHWEHRDQLGPGHCRGPQHLHWTCQGGSSTDFRTKAPATDTSSRRGKSTSRVCTTAVTCRSC